MADVFVSYSRDDRARVEQLAKALEARGFNVWWDPELLPGEQYAQKITRVLNEAKAVLVVWSKSSAARPWVLDEASVGRDRGVLVPVLVEKIDAPLGFRQVQAEDLSDWPGVHGEDNFERVVRALESLRGAPAAPRPASPFPPKPDPAKAGFGFMRGETAAQPAEKPKMNKALLAGGAVAAALVATLVIVGIVDKGGTDGPAPPDIFSPAGGPDGPVEAYGLTKKELAITNGQALIKLALQRGTIADIEKGAKAGDPTGQMLLCLAYDWGEGMPADASSARSWCEAASDQGQAMATYLLHFYHMNGSGGYTPNSDTAKDFLIRAADAGDARAQFDLGNRYLNGDGLLQDDAAALKYFRKSAEQGYQDSQFNVAWMYENGRGVGAPDYATAMLWYQKLADEGSPIGIRAVGWMHYNGWGVDKDVAKAIELYKKASDMGDGNASRNLATMYENGDVGVAKNLEEALKYYRKASEQGYKEADEDLKRLGFSN